MSSHSPSANPEPPRRTAETALHLMHAVSFNAAFNAEHLMRPRASDTVLSY